MRSKGFCMHSSHKFSFEPTLELPLELALLLALEVGRPVWMTFPKGPVEKKEFFQTLTNSSADIQEGFQMNRTRRVRRAR